MENSIRNGDSMRKELKYMNIEYTDKDKLYIEELVDYIEKVSQEIVNFFGIEDFGNKVEVKLWEDLSKYRTSQFKIYLCGAEKIDELPKWCCGFAYSDNNISYVETLCLEEYRKTLGHQNGTLDDLKHLILHEFTHAVHLKINDKDYQWLSEGLATTISHQYDNYELTFDATLEQIQGEDYTHYTNYHTMFYYVYETYGREYILQLVNNYELQKQETERLYNETVEYISNKTPKRK
ncbi:MAG: hypothetical protein E7166_06495 [Firmicutes bacterium]|nr:hypothetical protein [Bacillota bacterium]